MVHFERSMHVVVKSICNEQRRVCGNQMGRLCLFYWVYVTSGL